MIRLLARCPKCNSIFVCWNWVHSFGGNREEYERANPNVPKNILLDWGHECWSCNHVFETMNKIYNGIPYWILKLWDKFYVSNIEER